MICWIFSSVGHGSATNALGFFVFQLSCGFKNLWLGRMSGFLLILAISLSSGDSSDSGTFLTGIFCVVRLVLACIRPDFSSTWAGLGRWTTRFTMWFNRSFSFMCSNKMAFILSIWPVFIRFLATVIASESSFWLLVWVRSSTGLLVSFWLDMIVGVYPVMETVMVCSGSGKTSLLVTISFRVSFCLSGQ